MNDETVERLESRLAFLEQANQDLSDVVFRQDREITALKAQLAALAARIAAGANSSEQTEYTPEQERPPHY
jgi:SlyX protein